jgi:hypothetical protein
MPEIQPAHVFYYEFLFKDHRPPPCDRSDSDTALYAPAGDRNAADVPRAAASYIYDNRGVPLAYTGAATGEQAAYGVARTTSIAPAATPSG